VTQTAFRSDVVAFLQNTWFPPATAPIHRERYVSDPLFRSRVLATSATGLRLRRAWGSLYDRVWWDNASPRTDGEARRAMFPPDPHHMRAVVGHNRPRVVVLYGAMTDLGFSQLCQLYPERPWAEQLYVVRCPHPAAFDIATAPVMRAAAVDACAHARWPIPGPVEGVIRRHPTRE